MEDCVTRTAEETEAYGGRLVEALSPGDIVLLRGELGAGKTTLVRGAARALGILEPVVSPTFTVGRRLRGPGGVLCHLDLYRLTSLGDEEPDLLEDYLGDPDAISFVEWPEAGGEELRSRAALELELGTVPGEKANGARRITARRLR